MLVRGKRQLEGIPKLIVREATSALLVRAGRICTVAHQENSMLILGKVHRQPVLIAMMVEYVYMVRPPIMDLVIAE